MHNPPDLSGEPGERLWQIGQGFSRNPVGISVWFCNMEEDESCLRAPKICSECFDTGWHADDASEIKKPPVIRPRAA